MEMIEYAREITETFSRCQTRQADIETGIMDYVQLKSEIWDENDDTGLTEFLAEQDTESELCFTKVEELRYKKLVIFAQSKAILAPAPVQVSRLTSSAAQHITPIETPASKTL